MNKSILVLMFSILLISTISAMYEDINNENVCSIIAVVNENTTGIWMNLNLEGASFNYQTVKFGYMIFNLSTSEFLDGVDFKMIATDGSKYPVFTEVNVSSSYSSMIINWVLYGLGYSFNSDDIEANPSLLNQVIEDNFNNPNFIDGNWEIEKIGNDFNVKGDIGARFFNNYLKKITSSFKLQNHSLSYEADLTNQEMINGNYEIPIKVNINGEDVIKKAHLVIQGLPNETFVPTENLTIQEVKGLEFGTSVVFEEYNLSDYSFTAGTKLDVFNISTDKNTSGTISFKVNKTKANNPALVFMYVLEGTTWTKLTTRYLSSNADYYNFESDTPHFSIFMIAEEPPIVVADTSSSSSSSSSYGRRKVVQDVHNEEIKPEEEVNEEVEVTEIKLNEEKKFNFKPIITIGTIIVSAGIILFAIASILNMKNKKKENETTETN